MRFWHSATLAFIAFLTICISGCGGGGGGSAGTLSPATPITTVAEAQQHGKWTILVYLDADNDLESAALHNFNQMEAIGSTRDARVIVQLDRAPGHNITNGDWTDTRRYLIVRDSATYTINSIRLDEAAPLGERNMGSAQTLRDFVTWGIAQFPADHYCLVLWDHGTGWQTRTMAGEPPYKYVCLDETSNDQLTLSEIVTALAGSRVDLLAMDACYMGQLEVVYELRNCCSYFVGSPCTEPSPGYNYSYILNRLSSSVSPAQFAQIIVEEYAHQYPPPHSNIVLGAIDVSRVEELAKAADDFAQLLINKGSTYTAALASARDNSQSYYSSGSGSTRHYRDLWHYGQLCANAIGALAENPWQTLRTAFANCVIAQTHNKDTPNAHGLGIYIPPPGDYEASYSTLGFANGTLWDNWVLQQLQ